MKTLRLLLGDQLSQSLSSLKGYNHQTDSLLLCEVWDEATYVRHHKKKIVFLFSAQQLQSKGYRVEYIRLEDSGNSGSLKGEVARLVQEQGFERLVVTQPGEYRVLQDMLHWQQALAIPVEIRPDDRFLCSTEDFAVWARGRRALRMEYFYRNMRRQYGVLMQGDQPVGGQWNYDAQNRKPPKEGLAVPPACTTPMDAITQEVATLVRERFDDHFGDLEPFGFAVTREGALRVLRQFVEQRLCLFGDYQDAMIQGQPWMYHSHLSFYLNCGLLLPLECVHAAQEAYHQGKAPLNAVEGFIRQIMGWREYVRGVYWLRMPDYAQANFLGATRPLPAFYWTADTSMNCLHQCISETKKNAYAHHIQRLMVLGNFALLAGIAPAQVNEWFLIVYADAYEWVELPNVSGMILFADGGYLASKPYAAGGSYINRMSDYCKSCRYKVSKKQGPDACPFNYLYWDFLDRNRSRLQTNQRLAMMYKSLDRMDDSKKHAFREDSRIFLRSLE